MSEPAKSADNVVSLPTEYERRYVRGREADPMMQEVVRLMRRDGRTLSAIARQAGLAPATVKNWATGKTRRPQRISMEFVLREIGLEMGVYDRRTGRRVK